MRYAAGLTRGTGIDIEGHAYAVTCRDAAIDPAWDAMVEAGGGDLAQTSLWAASRQRLGFRAWQITVATAGRELQGGCQMYVKRLAPACSVAFVPRGPLLFAADPDAAPAVLRETVAHARRRGVRFLIVQPPEGADALEDAMTGLGFLPGVSSVAPEATIRLDITRSDDELMGAMSAMRRRNLRKALRSDLEVRQDDDIQLFHRLHSATAARQGFVPAAYDNLRAQWELLAPTANCSMFIGRHRGVAAAGIWITRFGGVTTFKLAGWDAAGPAPPYAPDAVHWAAMRWARSTGDRFYDFGGFDRHAAECLASGRPLPEAFYRSHSFYKLGFGGTPLLMPRARFLLLPPAAHLAFGTATQSLLASPKARRLTQYLRNGRFSGAVSASIGGAISRKG
ncbi:lipid II:glycine glycyltransferase FemX [Methylobacterium nigriterrae]|uniref:lipid II:glycine glycyltransferase FemX n=1 Tax=Methylobacterium nigriterrae TaxID=3127512 RepID=UPI003013B7E3